MMMIGWLLATRCAAVYSNDPRRSEIIFHLSVVPCQLFFLYPTSLTDPFVFLGGSETTLHFRSGLIDCAARL